ncbi:MAG: type IV pilus secretin PilQ [Panacagrimonas sp.]
MITQLARNAFGRGVCLALFALVGLTFGVNAHAQGPTLQEMDAVALDGGGALLNLRLSAPPAQPRAFTVEQPPRLSIDLPGTQMGLAQRYRRFDLGNLRSVTAAEAGGRTRLVLELKRAGAYQMRVQGNTVQIELPGAGAAALTQRTAGESAVNGIDFRRGGKGEGRVVISLARPDTAAEVEQEGGKVVARFRNARLGADLQQRLDVTDFATPVQFVDARREGASTVITVTPHAQAEFEQVAYQSGNTFTVELVPLTEERIEERRKQDPQYTGERISLSFQNVEIRALLQIIADVAGTNMVVSDSVTGEMAVRLQNVPWDQALDIILLNKGLGMRQQGNVMLVAPLIEFAERDKVEAEANRQQVELAPLRSELIQINYAKAADLAAFLKAEGNSVMSERGRVTVDERTNSLLVVETREVLSDVRGLIAKLDIPVKQVLIESRIVIANDDYSKELGARFGVSTVATNGGSGIVTTSGSVQTNDLRVQDFLNNGLPVPVGPPPPVGGNSSGGSGGSGDDGGNDGDTGQGSNRFNFSLPATPNAGRIALAVLGADYLVDLELSALQAEGRGEVVSTPRVITANAKEASIEQGVEIPFQESASSGATTITFRKAVLSLTVTPQITPDDRIIMDLEVKKDSVGQIVPTGDGGTAPSIDTREVNTQVLVDNGNTVVLGGVYENETRETINKIPLLGDLPLIGALFRNKTNVSNKDELLIFVTPKILDESLSLN